MTDRKDSQAPLTEEEEEAMAEAMDVLCLTFRAMTFMGNHSLDIAYDRGCPVCIESTVKYRDGKIGAEEMIEGLCGPARTATKVISIGRMLVEKWENANPRENQPPW